MRLVAQVLILALVFGLLPAPAQAALPATSPEPRAPLPDLPLRESRSVLVLAVVLEEGAPCVVFALVADPFWDPFVGMDPWEGSTFDPPTLHRYLYVRNDPADRIDPSGLSEFTLVQQMAIGAIIGILAANAIVQPRSATETVQVTLFGAIAGAGGVLLGATAVELYLAAKASTVILIFPAALRHIAQRHMSGGPLTEARSVFSPNISMRTIIDMVRAAESSPPVQQANSNLARIVDAGQIVGIDRLTGQPTSVYTVITTSSGRLVTMFPGLP